MHSTEKYSIKERQDIIKTLHLLGIPGLIAPESSAEIIYNVIEEIN